MIDGYIERKDGTHYYLGGAEVTEAEYRAEYPPIVESGERKNSPAGSSLVGWARPVVSTALGVHPKQVEEARALAKAKGVPVEFQADGRPVFTSSRQFREYARKHGFIHMGYAMAFLTSGLLVVLSRLVLGSSGVC